MSALLEYRGLRTRPPRKLTKGIDKMVDATAGFVKRSSGVSGGLADQADQVTAACEKARQLGHDELVGEIADCHAEVRRARDVPPALLVRAFGLIGAAAERALGFVPYTVQFRGALALTRGLLAEMATGEGKTLTVGLAAVFGAWRGRPCHVITSNDYLAERDCEKMTPLYALCGVDAGHVVAAMTPDERRLNYRRAIVCTTSKELLADFLKDRIQIGEIQEPARRLVRGVLGDGDSGGDRLLARGIHTVIVDEADSVLIDDAVTPLIISQKYNNPAFAECCKVAAQLAEGLSVERDFRVDYRNREITLTVNGHAAVESGGHLLPRHWRSFDRRTELVRQALVAKFFYLRDRDYVVEEEKIVIVDQSTGRLKRDSTWRQGLHQAVEVKEGVPMSDPTETLASLSFQTFFRMFPVLGGITGTAWSAAGEFWHVYRLVAVRVPTHRPCLREVWPSVYFSTASAKFDGIAAETERLSRGGRPVLIGTGSVAVSERLATVLDRRGLRFRLLNASRLAEEAAIIAEAGRMGAVTIATNMAGRGTDIALGPGVRELGGLHVIGAERMESARVDRQLAGRAGRQGDPGSARFFVSMDDELLVRCHPKPVLAQAAALLAAKSPAATAFASMLTSHAQRSEERKARAMRESVVRMDQWLDDALSFSGPRRIG